MNSELTTRAVGFLCSQLIWLGSSVRCSDDSMNVMAVRRSSHSKQTEYCTSHEWSAPFYISVCSRDRSFVCESCSDSILIATQFTCTKTHWSVYVFASKRWKFMDIFTLSIDNITQKRNEQSPINRKILIKNKIFIQLMNFTGIASNRRMLIHCVVFWSQTILLRIWLIRCLLPAKEVLHKFFGFMVKFCLFNALYAHRLAFFR